MNCDWVLVAEPAEEPLTLDEAKLQCRVELEAGEENGLISDAIRGAREDAEQYMQRGLFTQTWRYEQDDWSDIMTLPMAAPLQNDAGASPSTAVIVQYYDGAGVLQTLPTSAYIVDATAQPGRIVRAPNQVFPLLQSDRLARVVVTYVVGWSTVAAIPQRIKDGISILVVARHARADAETLEKAMSAAQSHWASQRVTWKPPACAA